MRHIRCDLGELSPNCVILSFILVCVYGCVCVWGGGMCGGVHVCVCGMTK